MYHGDVVAIAGGPESDAGRGVPTHERPSDIRILGDAGSVRAALSPLRVTLLRELREPASASGLAERLGTTRQRLAYHLGVLEKQGLVRLVEERQRRGCTERLLQRTARALVVDPEVLGGMGSDDDGVQDRFSSAYLVATAARVIGDVATLREGAREAGKRLATVTQEAEIRFESPAAMKRFTDEFGSALALLIDRYDSPGAASSRPFRLVTAMHPKRDSESGASINETGDES
jgi:DNA-binding transcriptional ArsR family regulator